MILERSADNLFTLFNESIKREEPLIFPTDTVYGIGAPISSVIANEKIYKIKKREQGKPFPLLIGSWEQLKSVTKELTQNDIDWLTTIWPGSYTVIMPAADSLPNIYKKDNKVAVRFVSCTWLQQAINQLGVPVTATSANQSGLPFMNSFDEIYTQFNGFVDLFIAGEPEGGSVSTVIDFTDNKKVIRP